MEFKLSEEQVKQVEIILRSFPIYELDKVNEIFKVLQKAEKLEAKVEEIEKVEGE